MYLSSQSKATLKFRAFEILFLMSLTTLRNHDRFSRCLTTTPFKNSVYWNQWLGWLRILGPCSIPGDSQINGIVKISLKMVLQRDIHIGSILRRQDVEDAMPR